MRAVQAWSPPAAAREDVPAGVGKCRNTRREDIWRRWKRQVGRTRARQEGRRARRCQAEGSVYSSAAGARTARSCWDQRGFLACARRRGMVLLHFIWGQHLPSSTRARTMGVARRRENGDAMEFARRLEGVRTATARQPGVEEGAAPCRDDAHEKYRNDDGAGGGGRRKRDLHTAAAGNGAHARAMPGRSPHRRGETGEMVI